MATTESGYENTTMSSETNLSYCEDALWRFILAANSNRKTSACHGMHDHGFPSITTRIALASSVHVAKFPLPSIITSDSIKHFPLRLKGKPHCWHWLDKHSSVRYDFQTILMCTIYWHSESSLVRFSIPLDIGCLLRCQSDSRHKGFWAWEYVCVFLQTLWRSALKTWNQMFLY